MTIAEIEKLLTESGDLEAKEKLEQLKLEEKLARERLEEKANRALEVANKLLEFLKGIDVEKTVKEFHDNKIAPDIKTLQDGLKNLDVAKVVKEFHETTVAPEITQTKESVTALKTDIDKELNDKADVKMMAEALQLKAVKKEVTEAQDEIKRIVSELKTSLEALPKIDVEIGKAVDKLKEEAGTTYISKETLDQLKAEAATKTEVSELKTSVEGLTTKVVGIEPKVADEAIKILVAEAVKLALNDMADTIAAAVTPKVKESLAADITEAVKTELAAQAQNKATESEALLTRISNLEKKIVEMADSDPEDFDAEEFNRLKEMVEDIKTHVVPKHKAPGTVEEPSEGGGVPVDQLRDQKDRNR